ncbi:MAG: PAS domain S-box protein, partial [Rubrobacter sp.]|nr:PAS domain S-box protein [Rubrobacter sp.]
MTGIPDGRYTGEQFCESEPFARSALDSLSAHIAILDESGVIGFVNKTWREFAVSNGAVGNVAEGANYLRVCESAVGEQSADAAAFAEGIRSVLSGRREEFALEYPCHSPTGKRWFVGRVTRFPADGPARAVVAHENITERKQAEEALRLGDRAIAASSNGIVITDPNQPDDPIIYVNPAFASMTGYSAQETLGRNCRFLQGTEREQPALEELRAALRDGRRCKVVLRNYKKDGAPFWNELSISPVRDREGKLLNFIGVQEDVTERKRAEEALRDSEERYRALYEDNPTMYFTLDEKGTVLSVNRFGAGQLGYTPEELVGRPVLDVFHEEDRESVSRYLSACLRVPERIGSWEARKTHKDGSVLWVRETVRVVRDPNGGMVILKTCEDVSERKRAERERAQLLVREQVARSQAETARQRLRAILDNLTEGVMVADPQGRVVFANPAAGAMLGATSGEKLEELPDLWEDFHLPGAVARCARNRESIEARVSCGE